MSINLVSCNPNEVAFHESMPSTFIIWQDFLGHKYCFQ